MPVEEGDWKIPQGAALPGKLLHGRAEAKFSYIYQQQTWLLREKRELTFPAHDDRR
jgi:hypothetical protein